MEMVKRYFITDYMFIFTLIYLILVYLFLRICQDKVRLRDIRKAQEVERANAIPLHEALRLNQADIDAIWCDQYGFTLLYMY